MDKLELTGQNLGLVFNFKSGHFHALHFWCYKVKLRNLKLKTRPKQLLGSLPLVIVIPDVTVTAFFGTANRQCKRSFSDASYSEQCDLLFAV
jgi:hypothetical protein